MASTVTHTETETRRQILRAAVKRFAHSGYAAASVQQIVDDAQVSKPALYYYFQDKAGLFQALVNESHDQKLELMQSAARRGETLPDKLVEILAALFDYFSQNRELVSISLATAFAAPGEVPEGLCYQEKCERNFEFIHALMKEGLKQGELDSRFGSRELAFGFYGQANSYLMSQLLAAPYPLDRPLAKLIVGLFLGGAAAKNPLKTNPNPHKRATA
jgi:TetR/AcrR family transcriptional repressor of mexJK operon